MKQCCDGWQSHIIIVSYITGFSRFPETLPWSEVKAWIHPSNVARFTQSSVTCSRSPYSSLAAVPGCKATTSSMSCLIKISTFLKGTVASANAASSHHLQYEMSTNSSLWKLCPQLWVLLLLFCMKKSHRCFWKEKTLSCQFMSTACLQIPFDLTNLIVKI